MRVSVFGLGYVGCVTAACLAQDGHEVVGVDINSEKINLIEKGNSPVIEPGLADIIERTVNNRKLRASLDSKSAVLGSDVSLVCVGTPSNDNGSLNTVYIENVCRDIGEAISNKGDYHVIVIRSTVLPGTVEELIASILEKHSGLKAGRDFGLCMNPEFLREGSALQDYYHPSLVVIGELDKRSGDIIEKIYSSVDANIIRTTIKTAEMVKYTCNAYHALKVVFANEIGNLCKAHNIDGQNLMEIFCQDRLLNISTAYLQPGFAFGGSCLPKDLRAMLYRAKERDVDSKLLQEILPSNQNHIDLSIKLVEKTGYKKIGILGLSFKPNTDDLRESPAVLLVETLIGRGYDVLIYDENLVLSQLVGTNKQYLENEIPHIASIICTSLDQLISQSEVIVITQGNEKFRSVPYMLKTDQVLIDLTGIAKTRINGTYQYEGICW